MLLNKTLDGNNRELKEWAIVYQWQLWSKYNRVYSEVDYLEMLKKLQPNSHDLKTLLQILEMLCFYYSEKYDLSLHYIKKFTICSQKLKIHLLKKHF